MRFTNSREEIGLGSVILVYAVLLAFGAALAILIRRLFGVDAARAMLFYCGLLFLCAACGVPRIIFLAIRNLAEFPLFPDQVVRLLFTLIGLLGIGVALFG